MKRLYIILLSMVTFLCATPAFAQKPLKKPPKPTQMTNSNQVRPANAQKNGITEPLLRDRTGNVYYYGEDEDEDEDDEFLFDDEEEEDDDYNLLDDDDEDDW